MNLPSADEVWSYYQAGTNYKSSLRLYDTVDRNERFYAGDQWRGADAPNMPKPVVNFIKRACQQRVATVMSNKLAVLFSTPNWPSQAPTAADEQQNAQNILIARGMQQPPEGWQNPFLPTQAECQLITAMFEADSERMALDALYQEGLKDACIGGDFVLYTYWNAGRETGQAAKGCIEAEAVDNVNYYPGDPNQRDPQKQPYVIISRRELLSSVRREAKANKVSQPDIDRISNDRDVQYQSGDQAKIELDQPDDGKLITLLYLQKDPETGHVWAQKAARGVVIRKAWDTGLRRYPVAILNWDLRKNSCHGRSEVQGLVPNQVAINKIFAMIILYLLRNGAPKVLYNTSAGIEHWDNSVTKAVAVNSDINQAAKYLAPPSMPADMLNLPATLLKLTMQMIGTSDAALGNVNPTNANAMLLAKEQAEVPSQTVRNRFYSFVQELAFNWLDMTLACFKTSRWVEVMDQEGNRYPAVFNPERFRDKVWMTRIDVGAARDWSQVLTDQKFASMVQSGQLDVLTYLTMQPDNVFNGRKDEVLASARQMQQQQQAIAAARTGIQPGGGGSIENSQNISGQVPS